MASPQVAFRAPESLVALIDAAALKNGRTRSEEILATLGERYAGEDAAPQVRRAAPRSPKAIPADPAQVAGVVKGAQLGTGKGLMGGAMDRAGIAEWDPSAKRPQYVRREAKGKGGR